MILSRLAFIFLFLCGFFIAPGPGQAAVAGKKTAQTKVVRIAYLENGPYWFFRHTYDAFRKELAKRGEMSFLYPAGMHLSPGWQQPQEALEKAAKKLMSDPKVDLIIGAGSSAVRALQKANNGKTPFIGFGMSDPVRAGLVFSAEDSGLDNFTCEAVSDRWNNILLFFHKVVGFKKLGLIYPDGREGRFYAGLDEAVEIGAKVGFEVLAEEIPDESVNSCLQGVAALKDRGADAFYVAPLFCFDWEMESSSPEYLFNYINTVHKLPTLARNGSIDVQGGALMGYSTWNITLSGKQLADAAMRIFQGEKPRDIKLNIMTEPRIALNLQTALEVGVNLPFDMLLAADEIYETTSRPDINSFLGN